MTGHNRLAHLAAEISKAHEGSKTAAEVAAERAIAAGHMLIEAKGLVRHGEWAGRLADNVSMSERTARRYMQLARAGLNSATVADLGIRAAAESLSKSTQCLRRIVTTGRVYHSAEKIDPGSIRRILDGMLERGEEPKESILFREARRVVGV